MKISGKSDVLYDKAVVGANLPSKAGGPPFYSVDVYDLFSSESIII